MRLFTNVLKVIGNFGCMLLMGLGFIKAIEMQADICHSPPQVLEALDSKDDSTTDALDAESYENRNQCEAKPFELVPLKLNE